MERGLASLELELLLLLLPVGQVLRTIDLPSHHFGRFIQWISWYRLFNLRALINQMMESD
jgi:hypothetical protein